MTKAEAKAAMALHHRRGISLKAAWAQVRGGRASPGGTRTTRSAKSSNGSSPKGGRIGRIYQAGTTAAGVLAPVTDEALFFAKSGRQMSDLAWHANDAKDKILSVPYATNLAIEGATAIVDKKMGQAAAISRGSVSAILPELVLGAVVAPYRNQGARVVHQVWSEARNGYDPAFNGTVFNDAFKLYRGLKHGGQIARKLRTRSAAHGGVIARILEPVGATILRPLGMSW